MNQILLILQIIIGVTLSGLILVQVKGTGFGRVWGFTNNFSRRGLEGFVFKLTFVVAALFMIVSIATIL
jgi:protein translocase SecG subunit